MTVAKRVHRVSTWATFKVWSARNWLKGYRFGPVQRFRCCKHTTPFHYRTCPKQGRLL